MTSQWRQSMRMKSFPFIPKRLILIHNSTWLEGIFVRLNYSYRPSGMHAAHKLARTRRINRWADKAYKKSHLSTRWKSNPFGLSSHAKGIVIEKMYLFPLSFMLFLAVSNLSSLTLLSVSAFVSNSSRTVRRSLLSSLVMVAWTSLKKMMKSLSLVWAVRVTLLVIFLVFVSKSLRSLVFPCGLCGLVRKKNQEIKQ